MKKYYPLLWKLYFWGLAIYLILGYLGNFATFARGGWLTILDLFISIPALIGLYNYAYNKAYLPLSFWKIYALAFLVYEIVFNIYLAPHIYAYDAPLTVTLLAAIPFVPLLLVLFLYSFKQKVDLK